MEQTSAKRYSNGEVTVIWKPELCIHSGNCVAGLPLVFNPKRRPWVDVQAASTQEIVEQVLKCPSGALSVVRHGPDAPEATGT